MSKELNDKLAVLALDRAAHMGYKGKRRDDFVLDYMCGAASALYLAGSPLDGGHLSNVTSLLLAAFPYERTKRMAEDCDMTPKQLYEAMTEAWQKAKAAETSLLETKEGE